MVILSPFRPLSPANTAVGDERIRGLSHGLALAVAHPAHRCAAGRLPEFNCTGIVDSGLVQEHLAFRAPTIRNWLGYWS